jgi:hypothetical protein
LRPLPFAGERIDALIFWAVFGWRLSLDGVCQARPGAGDDDQPLCTLGIFLLLAARNPSANRSLIAFTVWSSFAHAALMAVQAFRDFIPRRELAGVAFFVVIGVALIVLAPAKKSGGRASAAVA